MWISRLVQQVACGQDISRGEIGLHFCEISESPRIIVLRRAIRKPGDDEIVVLSVEPLEEPNLPFLQRTGKGDSWDEAVELQPILVLHGRNEVRRSKTEMVISNPSLDVQHAARTLTVFRRIPARFRADGSD